MMRTAAQLLEDALAIWRAGVAAVDSARLVAEHVVREGNDLLIGEDRISLAQCRRIVVVGAGKAGAGMAEGLERALGPELLAAKQVTGWLNVPEDCVRPLQRIHLHGARPAGVNEPTAAGVHGAEQILRLVESASPEDLCICLLSGGGSALLPAPLPGISLADKQAVTRHLSAAGANIRELNTVRKQLSRIKGGGLARACRARRLWTLIISDVLGDPLDIIASGPTVPDPATPQDALHVLEQFGGRGTTVPETVFQVLKNAGRQPSLPVGGACEVTNLVIGNNATAVDAAGIEAERRGYSHAMLAARTLEGPAEGIGEHLADLAWRMHREPGPDCLITGGEPTVQLAPAAIRGKGGRNQQLVLAALQRLRGLAAESSVAPGAVDRPLHGIVLLSGGTDGEDGPTDAAGAWISEAVDSAARERGSEVADFLRRNDAYSFFAPLGGLLKTGPTHTNVCDLRVVVTSQEFAPQRRGRGNGA